MDPVKVKAYTRVLRTGKRVQVASHTRETPERGPHTQVTKPIPARKDVVWEYSLQDHRAKRAGRHRDLRLADEMGNVHSWAIRKFPGRGETSLAFQTFTHRPKDMYYEGTWKGYGAGKVSVEDEGRVLVHQADNDKVLFSVVRGRDTDDFALVRLRDKAWRIVNMSPASAPYGKPKYRETSWDEKAAMSDDVVIGPKMSGAHSIIHMRPGKRTRAFSAGLTKGGEPIEYTHKIPGLYQEKRQGGRGDTFLRGEVVAVDSDGTPLPEGVTAGLLNSNVLHAVGDQRQGKIQLKVFLFDIPQMNGVDMTAIPYSKRISVLEEIAKRHPTLQVVPVARTKEEKTQVLKAIRSGKHPLTKEGVVLWDSRGPKKMKRVKDYDVVIREVFEGRGKASGSAGAFAYSHTPRGPVAGKVGTGFSDTVRRAMWEDREQMKGRIARVLSQERLRSGALKSPAYRDLHPEKNVA